MVPELRDLLHDAADSPDGDAVDTDILLGQARGRVRRRRNTTIAGASLGIAAVALVAAVITQVDLGGTEQGPTAPVPNVNAKLSEAPLAKPGQDYQLVSEYDIDHLAKKGGRLIESVTPGDLLVYRYGHDGSSDAREIGLLEPTTGNRTPFPKAIANAGGSRIITSGNMVAGASYGEAGKGFWYFDTSNGDWEVFKLSQLSEAGITGINPNRDAISRIQFGTEDVRELYLSIGPADDPLKRDRLVSIDLGSKDLNVIDHGKVSLWVISTEDLAYLPPGKPASKTLTIRDLNTGKEHEVTIPRGEDSCTTAQMWMRSDRVMTREECLTESGEGYSLFQVFTRDGEPMRAVTGTQFDVLTAANKLMLIRSRSPQGLFLYNTDNGEVLRVSKRLAPFTDLGASEGDRWVFLTPIDNGKGVRVHVAELL